MPPAVVERYTKFVKPFRDARDARERAEAYGNKVMRLISSEGVFDVFHDANGIEVERRRISD